MAYAEVGENNMTRHHYYVGTRDQNGDRVPMVQWDEIDNFLLATYGGFTRYEAMGAWLDAPLSVYEPSMVYEGITKHATDPRIVASRLATLAHQSAVLWTEESLNVGFAST